ncbi:MAG TPA: hypothetical protein VHL53_03280, partial [Acidimicrobiia bacterium]|nr:hypothetical protein [Acidimicrobiia bacterium]
MHVAVLWNGTEREIALDLDPDQETVASLADAVTGTGGGHAGLLVDGRFVDGSTPLSRAGLRQGSVIEPAAGPNGPAVSGATFELRLVGGIEAGRRLPLPPGSHIIGRGDVDV